MKKIFIIVLFLFMLPNFGYCENDWIVQINKQVINICKHYNNITRYLKIIRYRKVRQLKRR